MSTNATPPERFDVDESSSASAEGRKLLRMVRRGKWLILLAVLIAGGLGYLYYVRSVPIYASHAQMLFIKKSAQMPLTGPEERFNYEDTLTTHMLMLRSPLVVEGAVEQSRLHELPSFAGAPPRLVVEAVIAGLETKSAEVRNGTTDPNVVEIRYSGTNSNDCRLVLEAVMDSYRRFLGETYRDAGEESVALIRAAKEDLSGQLETKEKTYAEFRSTAPLMWRDDGAFNLHEGRMQEIENDRTAALTKRAELIGRIRALEKVIADGGSREAALLVAGVEDGEARQHEALRQRLFDAELEAEEESRHKGRNHPDVKAVALRVKRLREELQRRVAGEGPENDPVAVALEALQHERRSIDERITELDSQFESERKRARELAAIQMKDDMLRRDVDRTQQTFNAVLEGLQEMDLVGDYGGMKTQVIKPPADGVQVAPKFSQILLTSIVLGLFFGLGLSYVQELLDRRFRGIDDIRARLDVPIVGQIPVIEEADSQASGPLAPVLCTHHRPTSHAAEAYRGVRTSLFFSTRNAERRVIQVTSPNQGDGKSTAAANVAISIALSGQRVVLVDADFRRPRVHQLFGRDRKPGLGDILVDGFSPDEAVHECDVENLHLMPCGRPLDDPAERLTSPRFTELLETLGRDYDFVVVDTPPLLAVTDPAIVAPRVDGVLLVLRLNAMSRDAALRARDILSGLEVNLLGVVVNAVDEEALRYDHGYGYRYGYGYTADYRPDDSDPPSRPSPETAPTPAW